MRIYIANLGKYNEGEYDQFSQGYLSIKKAVEAIHAGRQKQETLLDLVYLDQQKLASGVYEKMLYPME